MSGIVPTPSVEEICRALANPVYTEKQKAQIAKYNARYQAHNHRKADRASAFDGCRIRGLTRDQLLAFATQCHAAGIPFGAIFPPLDSIKAFSSEPGTKSAFAAVFGIEFGEKKPRVRHTDAEKAAYSESMKTALVSLLNDTPFIAILDMIAPTAEAVALANYMAGAIAATNAAPLAYASAAGGGGAGF